MSNPILTTTLSGYARSMGFADERERFGLILSVPTYQHPELERWLDSDGTREGLLKILNARRPVRGRTTEDTP
jgi:hypothetical protein